MISNALLFGFLLYYAVKYLFSHLTFSQVESPIQFVFKAVIFGTIINFSFFFMEQILDLLSMITLAIRNIGEILFNKNICFSELILIINNNIAIDSTALDIFSLDGIIKATLSTSLLALVFTYSFRYILIKVFILLTPFAILSLLLNSSSWFFRAWLRCVFSLLFMQIIVAIVLLIMFSLDYSSTELFSKFIYIGGILTLIKIDSFVREFLGGISTTFSQNVHNFFKK